ncbi:MAG: hypothetical protein IT443_03235 [Phycisphaeraceae bacterium]|nr:hypothetical protein [Phycisphaeraceae bacterium]
MTEKPRRVLPPLTLAAGVVVILLCEALLAVDFHARGHVLIGHTPSVHPVLLPAPRGPLEQAARLVAVHMTPFCWAGYLLVFDGLLEWLSRRRHQRALNPLRARPHRFIIAWLTSIPVWCYFDYVNFAFLDAWRYHGLPAPWPERYAGYFLSFAAISPGMFAAAALYQHLGLRRLRSSPVRIPLAIQIAVLILGLLFVIYPFLVRDPIGNLTLWVSLLFLLDPLNHWLGQPSILGDWRAGRWGRTLSLMLGGATCGFCWEFWNYWAVAKWTYHLPFLGSLAEHRYFEMPWVGFQGFLPFALECWVVLNTILWTLDKLHLRVAEPLPDDTAVM